jgi:hypothetical protein
MHAPQVFVVRTSGDQFAVHPLESELIQYYSSEQDAIKYALFMLRWLGHSGEAICTRVKEGVMHVTCSRARHSRWDLSEI